MSGFAESVVEDAALAWLEGLDWRVVHGPDIAPEVPAAERTGYGEIVLARRLRDALARLNPALPPEALDDAFHQRTRPEGATLQARNRTLHRLLVDGATVEYRAPDGAIPRRSGAGTRLQSTDYLGLAHELKAALTTCTMA